LANHADSDKKDDLANSTALDYAANSENAVTNQSGSSCLNVCFNKKSKKKYLDQAIVIAKWYGRKDRLYQYQSARYNAAPSICYLA
jgi:hypothetical protein